MKKLLSVAALSLLMYLPGSAQWTCSDTVIVDTIHYFYNKYHFRTGKSLDVFDTYKSIARTHTAVSHVGNKFLNDEPLDVTGLEGFFISSGNRATPSNQNFPVRLILCDIDAATGKPKFPPIDSVTVNMEYPSPSTYPITAVRGGNFTTPRRVNGDFAVLLRNGGLNGDTVFVMRTNCHVPGSPVPPGDISSDDLGFARRLGTFNSTAAYNFPGFGSNTTFEFMLAPRVQYTVHAGHETPEHRDGSDTIYCTWQTKEFKNQSSSRINNRMFNLIEFKNYWGMNTFHPNTLAQYKFPGEERGISWHFYSEDQKNFVLPAGQNSLLFYTGTAYKSKSDPFQDSTTCYQGNWFHARLYGMGFGGGYMKFSCDQYFNYCTRFCEQDNVGLGKIDPLNRVHVFPNPTAGEITLTGLPVSATISVYNITGSLRSVSSAKNAETKIQLDGLADGTYLIRVTTDNSTRSLKVTKVSQ